MLGMPFRALRTVTLSPPRKWVRSNVFHDRCVAIAPALSRWAPPSVVVVQAGQHCDELILVEAARRGQPMQTVRVQPASASIRAGHGCDSNRHTKLTEYSDVELAKVRCLSVRVR